VVWRRGDAAEGVDGSPAAVAGSTAEAKGEHLRPHMLRLLIPLGTPVSPATFYSALLWWAGSAKGKQVQRNREEHTAET
jgi:hypothetical protein